MLDYGEEAALREQLRESEMRVLTLKAELAAQLEARLGFDENVCGHCNAVEPSERVGIQRTLDTLMQKLSVSIDTGNQLATAANSLAWENTDLRIRTAETEEHYRARGKKNVAMKKRLALANKKIRQLEALVDQSRPTGQNGTE